MVRSCYAAVTVAANAPGWVLVRVRAYEEDDPEDERQPCVASATHAFEIHACPCGSFTIAGPNYVGVHAPINLALVHTEIGADLSCNIPPTGWEIVQGEQLLEPGDPGAGVFYERTAGGAPGTVTFRATYVQGVLPCVVQKTVHVVEHYPVTLRYTAYIRCQVISAPGVELTRYFGGDNRGTSRTAASYRGGFQTSIRVSDYWGQPNGLSLQCAIPEFGLTTEYDPASIQNVPTSPYCAQSLVPGSTWSNSTTHPVSPAAHSITFERISHGVVRVRFHLDAGNPLITFLAPNINADLSLRLEQTVDPATGDRAAFAELEAGSTRDNYPAHELYANDVLFMDYDPGPAGHGPLTGLNSQEVLPALRRPVPPLP